MTALTLGRWGNSTAVRLPKSLLIKFNLQEGDVLRVVPSDTTQLILEPIKQEKRKRGRYTLAEVMPKSVSLAKLDDWDEMPAVGEEVLL